MSADTGTGNSEHSEGPAYAGHGETFASSLGREIAHRPGLILASVGTILLSEILHEPLDLLETYCAAYERNGDCALSLFAPGWCQLCAIPSRSAKDPPDAEAARSAGAHCCEFTWNEASRRALELGGTVDLECGAGAHVLAAPIRLDGETIGSVTACYGDPRRDPAQLRELAARRGVDYEELRARAEASAARPEFIAGLVRKRLLSAAQLIGEIVNRKRAEEALRRSEFFLGGIFEQSPSPMWISDHAGTLVGLNQACRNLLHITDDEVVGKYNVLKDSVVAEQGHMPLVRRVYEHGEIARYELRYDSSRLRGIALRRSAFVILEVSMFPIRDTEGQVRNVLIQHRDITEQRLLEQQLAQAQKLESLGRLAGGVAHDFNNLLTVINGYSDMLLDRIHAGDPLRPPIEEIRKAGERAAGLTQQLLAFSRKQVARPRPLSLNAVVEESHSMLARLLGEDVEVVNMLDPALGQVMMDPGQMHQVLMNLLVNARDAMPSGGKVVIETANIELDEECAVVHPDIAPGQYVLLAVSDNGLGMDEETQRRLFEPFFTTKPQGAGTGLGLSLVYGIVHQNHGWIWVYSEPGKGTTLKIYLPRIDAPAPLADGAPRSVAGRRASGTILLVEDQPQVRKLALEVLQDRGYQVLEAAGGAGACELSERHPGTIDLLLTDVVMPGMTGKELADTLRPRRPHMRVLYMSGYAESTIMHHGVLDAGVEYLSKPFTPEGLALRVQEVLAEPWPEA
jgi:PAS domain S-box-containing protein